MIGMMDDMRFVTERRHEALLAEAEARRLAKGSPEDFEDEAPTPARGPGAALARASAVAAAARLERTHLRALRAGHAATGSASDHQASISPKSAAPCGGTSPETCSEGQAAAA